MRVIFLGTGGTYPCTERNVVSIGIQLGRAILLLDCGEGTQRQFMRSNASFMATRWIFISHYHGDHFLGLPGLVQSMNLNDREEPLDIYGPEGTSELMSAILTAGYFGAGFEIISHDLQPGDHIEFDEFCVETAETNHTVPGLAYAITEPNRPGRFYTEKANELGIPPGPLFRRLQNGESVEIDGRRITPNDVLGPPRPGRKIAYSGDTRPSQEIIELARDCDLLIHDATLLSDENELAGSFGHSTAIQAAQVALEANAGQLALIHYSPRYRDVDPLTEEARTIFSTTFAPADLDEIIIRVRE